MALPVYNAADDILQAIIAGGGMSESTVGGQVAKALAALAAKQTSDAKEAAAIAAAQAKLTAHLAHIQDPKNH
jgi:hypothetical protein